MMSKVKRKEGEFISSLNCYQHFLILIFTLACTFGLCCCSDASASSMLLNDRGEDHPLEIVSTEHITDACISKCPEENRTNSEHLNVACGKDCYMRQCTLGCALWELALESSCQAVCNKTDDEPLEPKELYCVMGCNNAVNRYFKWLVSEVGTPQAPALVADSLTATSLSLEWEIPIKLLELTKGKPYAPKSYLVQWRYEEVVGDWKFCRNQSMGDNSTVRVDNLQPYTKYRFRVALLLSPNYDEVLISEQSVIISTLAMGVPLSEPAIVRAVAVDHTRISVSWEPGPFPNGPILSYVLQIRDLSSEGYSAIKDIPASENTNFYMADKLLPARNYSVLVAMRNAEGEGPPAEMIVTTPPQPPVKDDEPEPKLILGAEYRVLSQGSDILSESPEDFYFSDNRIMGIAIHIAKQLIFVSDEAGFIYKAPLEKNGKKEAIFSPQSGSNFLPLSLSMDWLNNHLYVLGEVIHPNSQRFWQISRCGLDGHGLTIAIAGLHRKPSQIQVDPYNGYLFWVVPGSAGDSGLFRLDLGDVSNGVKHEVKLLQMIQGGNLGAFAVDYTRFRLVVPTQDQNTVISVTLDGKDREDIRKNTQSPKFNIVKSLAMANGIFYWTNGNELLMEEHHTAEDSYYHNAYPDLSNGTFVAVCVDLPSVQPIPVPVNPPRHVQALLSAKKAKISWRIPHLLGNQGKGAWQEWTYELEIIDGTSVSNVIRNIKGAYFTVEKLKPNTNYTFRAAAYTMAGKGPWSTEFRAKTLKSSHDRYLIWSSSDGLLQSDIIGEHIHTLIPKSELGEHDISDMAWFEDVLFFVSNSTIRFYNRTSGLLSRFGELDSVESIGVDWIGKRIYWSNPTQQLITRASLNGNEQEPLPILAVARELKIDSLRGHIYYSTGHAVEVCRLNGKNRTIYFNVPLYSGKQVMGLTLDMDNERVFWIVRSYEASSLFSAPMAKDWNKDIIPIETTLEERSLNGPLTHFSDRLLWLQDDHTVVVGDMTGKNLANIRNSKLNGLRSVSVIDPTHHVHPNMTNSINVLPEQIDNRTITINGTWKAFNITWESVKTVTYGDIFYEIRIRSDVNSDVFVRETTSANFHYTSHQLPPYSALDITIRAFTYWASCKPTYARLNSPAAAPSIPTKPRVFITHYHDPFRRGLNITATFRWGSPSKPNGPITGYKIFSWYEEDGHEKRMADEFEETGQEQVTISNLVQNVTYYFQVEAFTMVGGGMKTHPIQVNTNHENPIPIILVATNENILEIDLDLNTTHVVAHTGNPIAYMAYIKYEKRILWINENKELVSYNGTKTKIATINSEILSLTVDWIERIVFWVQVEDEGSSIYQLDLYQTDGKQIGGGGKKILTRPTFIKDLIVSPTNQTFFWLEFENLTSTTGTLFQYNYDLDEELIFPEKSQCLNDTFRNILLDTSSLGENKLILVTGENGRMFSYGLRTEACYQLKVRYDNDTLAVVKDSSHIYVLKNDTILTYNHKQNLQHINNITQPTQIMAYFYQHYPPKRCLTLKQKISELDYIPELVEKNENYLLLQLPLPETHANCTMKLSGVKYTITYTSSGSDDIIDLITCKTTDCKTQIAYDSLTKIQNLKPFTKYKIRAGINNYYGEKMGLKTIYGPTVIYSTAPGAPSQPRNIIAEAISPTEAVVQWLKPLEFNSDSVWFEVHWQTENPNSRVVNRQQRLVTSQENLVSNNTDQLAINLSKLLPSQTYTIWIQAYSTNQTFSISSVVQIETFSEPDNITVEEATAYSLRIHWKNHMNISKYILEYKTHGNSDYKLVAESSDSDLDPEKEYFFINGLQPKTQYTFFLRIFYSKRDVPYIWPADNRFTFETLGDNPTAPGKPVIYHVSGEVYKVLWEPAKENGAPIEEYSLEALQSRFSNRIVRRSTNDEEEEEEKQQQQLQQDEDIPSVVADPSVYQSTSIQNYTTILQSQLPWAEEPQPIEDKWIVHYNGTDSYWIIKDLHPINLYSFRVRARNSYGWGPYSSTSEPISEPFVSPERRDSLLLAIFVPVMVVTLCVISAGCMMFVLQKRSTTKKIFHDGNSRIPDVELANLRELPRGGNFIHSNNILYTPGPLTDADVALLPQIRRDQITMSSFLGSGAFGEVYEGCVRNVGDEPETRVAIKTLRKGATEQEKGEFLQEAQLMSNFKHEHILRLIGVCFDNDALYIIMELMQGGDLLSYLRQSRPTVGTPSSLTLLDLISMCVDVASGCRYLEEMHFVHRDLACRNCLVSSVDPEYRVVKIGDFGLARDIYKNDYYRKEGEGLLPVRWMSPESLVDGVFTSQSDIWAFGVLCWEIMTLGQQPYPARNNVEVLHYVRDGGRLGRPIDCPEDLYQLMLKCWSYCPEDRPTFRYCLEILQALKNSTSDAIQITAQNANNRITNDGIFNPSYLGPDVNHNHRPGTLKFNSDENADINIEPPIIITPTSSTTSTIIPKYLELLYDENDEQPASLISDGYEIPLATASIRHQEFVPCIAGSIGCPDDIINECGVLGGGNGGGGGGEKERTFSSSSTVSRSSSPNLVNSLGQYKTMNHILTVALPPNSQEDCTSKDKLLVRNELVAATNKKININNNNINNINNNSNNNCKPVYSNTQPEIIIAVRSSDDNTTRKVSI